ncbi:MAG: molybdopterin cofactor-binding domain-containing protein [Bdellovibrionia bacterium]
MSVGKNIPHDSALGHVTGESIFIDDRPFLKGELWVGYLGSPVAAGVLKSIDTTQALKVPGVAGIFTAADLAHNSWGTIFSDQPILIDIQIAYRDEPICVIAATSREAILKAKRNIQFVIEETQPVFTIDEAIEKEHFLYRAHPIILGDADLAIKNAPHRLKGAFECGGQEHFYMESQASVVYPLENGALEVHSSSQHPTETQHVVAHTLGIPLHKVVCVVKRMGGAFGGKESQAAPFAALAALVAKKLKKPARMILTKDEDMEVTGKRHPFKNFYEIGFDSEGRILGLKVRIYSNGGAYADLSSSVLERAMFHVDGAYFLPNAHIEGAVCRTNMHSNTAFRGFGGPQGTMTIESILEDIAIYLKKDAFQIRQLNCYGKYDRNITHYGQVVDNNLLPELFERLHLSSKYSARLEEIVTGNEDLSSKTLRGISMTAVKFGIAFTAKFLNQGSAQVNVHRDGTIQVSTGATEMGQGVNVKIQQTVAHAFSVPHGDVQVMPTSTEKNHNTSPTAASAGADINCAAALKACEAIKIRLRWLAHLHFRGEIFDDLKEAPPVDPLVDLSFIQFKDKTLVHEHTGQHIAFHELLTLAYHNRMFLGEYAFYKTEGLGFEKKSGQGTPFKYFTNGVAVSEIEIDEYTGQLKVVRVDILMDLGRPINPGIDLGQVTGGFIQGQGWVTTEKLFYNEKGQLLSHSPTTYKIPNIQDTPRIFNVELLENDGNQGKSIFGSKAVGEPPLLLSASVWTAVKHALSFRTQGQIPEIKSPVTAEEILLTLSRWTH